MLDLAVAIVLALIVGAFGGFVSSVAKWLETTDPFNTRKNVKAILVGIFAGLALGVASAGTLTADQPIGVIIITLTMIFLAAVGTDQLTSRVSGMIAQNTVATLNKQTTTTAVVTSTSTTPTGL